MQTSVKDVKISKWENPDFWYPDSDSDSSQNLMGSDLAPDPSSDCFHKVPTSSVV